MYNRIANNIIYFLFIVQQRRILESYKQEVEEMKAKYTLKQFKDCYEHTSKDTVLLQFYYDHIELVKQQKDWLEVKKYLVDNKDKTMKVEDILKMFIEKENEEVI